MARPPDIDGRDGGGLAEGLPERDILQVFLHYRPPIILVYPIALLAIAVRISVALFSLYWHVVAAKLKAASRSGQRTRWLPVSAYSTKVLRSAGTPLFFGLS